jgi:hypothetical protein
VSGAPNLPAGFTDTFASRYIDAGELRQHVVIGGEARRCCWPGRFYPGRPIRPIARLLTGQ